MQWHLHWVYAVSYVMLLVNLLPLFPLDGGQMLHALLWQKLGWFRAAHATYVTGMIGSFPLIAYSLARPGGVLHRVLLPLIGVHCLLVCATRRHALVTAAEVDDDDDDELADPLAEPTTTRQRRRRHRRRMSRRQVLPFAALSCERNWRRTPRRRDPREGFRPRPGKPHVARAPRPPPRHDPRAPPRSSGTAERMTNTARGLPTVRRGRRRVTGRPARRPRRRLV